MIENHLLHAAAWGFLRVLPPRDALRWTMRVARVFPKIDDVEGRKIADALASHGTCLSRAVTVASRLVGAEIVIGVGQGIPTDRDTPFAAHAWVELEGVPLRAIDVGEGQIVRYRADEPRARPRR